MVDNGTATVDPITAKATTAAYQNVVLVDMSGSSGNYERIASVK